MVLCLYQAMMEEHRAISKSFRPENELLRTILKAPAGTFSISLKYLFLFRDYVEIMRSYQSVASLQRKTIASHKSNLVGLFTALQSQGQLRKDLDQEDIDYLMDLSGLVRTFFMMNILSSELRPANYAGLQKKYMTFVNRLLFPYLTAKGILGFKKFKIS